MTSLLKPSLRILKNSSATTWALIVHQRQFNRTAPVAQTFRQWYQSLWAPRSPPLPPYQHIAQVGDPVLRRKAVDVPAEAITGPEVKYLVRRMVHVLRKYKCVGLAAPQIGSPLNIMIMEFSQKTLEGFAPEIRKAKRMEVLPLTVLINPKLTVTNYTKVNFVESCESVRGYSAEVPRYQQVTISGSDTDGRVQELSLHGWNARIAQHEADHLNGVIYTDIMDHKTFGCSCWQAVNSLEGRVYIDFRK